MNEQKTYTSKELNEILEYNDPIGNCSGKRELMRRCKNAGLIIECIETPRGLPNQYIIVEDNFHIEGEKWVDAFCHIDWEVSSEGRIRRKSTKKLMGYSNTEARPGDYVRICMIDPKTKRSTNQQLNRVVFFSFHPELLEHKDKIQIDHINGIRTDNRLENLRPLSNIINTELRDNNQSNIKTLTTELIVKYGYEKIEKILKNLLTNEHLCDIILIE